MISFLQIDRKGTTFCAHSQRKMHKNGKNVHISTVLCIDLQQAIAYLMLIVSVMGVISGEMQATALLALQCPTGDEIAHINHVTQLTDVTTGLDTLEEALGLFIEHIQTVPGTVQTQVRAHNTHVVGHNLVDFLNRLGNKHFLLVGHRTLIVPFRYPLVEVVLVNMFQGVTSSSLRINHRLDEGVAGQAVAAMQTCARALAKGIEALDAGLSVEVYLDTATHIVSSRAYGDVVGSDVDAHRQALLVDIGEVVARLFGVLMSDVQTDVV